MEKKNIKDILEKVQTDDFTAEEEMAAKLWLFQLNRNKKLHLSEERLDEVSDKMWSSIAESQNKPVKNKSIRLWPRVVAAAAAIFLIVLGITFFSYQRQQPTLVQDVLPGRVGATLTLANGKKITLSEATTGEIAKESGISVTKSADGQLVYEIKETDKLAGGTNTLSTSKGETYILTLPDKSKVWLNAASSLTYSAGINKDGLRKVKLDGEAYFEIAKDKKHPFIVQTATQQVEVLGTHFNVNSYSNEPDVRTTLLEGIVKVSTGKTGSVLKPNQQAILIDHKITVKSVNAEDEIAWKDGVFLFQDEPLANIMRRISRWYNVDVVFADGVNQNQLYGGGISRYNNVSTVLEMLESTKDVRFKIEGRRIFVMK